MHTPGKCMYVIGLIHSHYLMQELLQLLFPCFYKDSLSNILDIAGCAISGIMILKAMRRLAFYITSFAPSRLYSIKSLM